MRARIVDPEFIVAGLVRPRVKLSIVHRTDVSDKAAGSVNTQVFETDVHDE